MRLQQNRGGRSASRAAGRPADHFYARAGGDSDTTPDRATPADRATDRAADCGAFRIAYNSTTPYLHRSAVSVSGAPPAGEV